MQTQSARWPTAAIVIIVVLSILIAIVGIAGVIGAISVGRMREANADLEQRIVASEERIRDLEADLAAAQQAAESQSGDPLADAFGAGGLGDLLRGLLNGGSGDNLGGLEDLLNGLLGSEGGDLGDLLGGATGGLDMGALGQCLTTAPGSLVIGDQSLDSQVDDIAAAVEEIRGLTFPSEIDPIFVSSVEMGERVRDLAAEEYPPELADFETRLWVALGMLEPGYDLAGEQLDLLDSAVAGYYDPDTGDLVVAADSAGEPLGAVDEVTLAHELIHALTDARLQFPDSIEDPTADPERGRAIQALIEGDATLGMQQFSLGALDLMDQFGMMLDPRVAASQADLADFPYILSNGLQLPYLEGMSFACALYAEGGWERVDQAYANPPDTTAEILFPELYLEDWSPSQPVAGGDPGADWTLLDSIGSQGTIGFGAIDLLTIFSAPGDDTNAALDGARERVEAWGGGLARLWSQGEQSAVLISLVDSNAGEFRLCQSMLDWEGAAFPSGEAGVLVECDGDNVMVAIGPDEATASSLLG